jgi:hypothetical protein
MRSLLILSALCAAGAARADCTPQADSWITLEVVAAEIAGDEAVELVDIDRNGCATIRYASFDRRAGLYRRQLQGDERAQIATLIEQGSVMRFDTKSVQAQIAAAEDRARSGLLAGQPERSVVACGDTYRLSIETVTDTVHAEWYAPKQAIVRHPDVTALSGLVAVIESVQRAAAADGKDRIAEVQP